MHKPIAVALVLISLAALADKALPERTVSSTLSDVRSYTVNKANEQPNGSATATWTVTCCGSCKKTDGTDTSCADPVTPDCDNVATTGTYLTAVEGADGGIRQCVNRWKSNRGL